MVQRSISANQMGYSTFLEDKINTVNIWGFIEEKHNKLFSSWHLIAVMVRKITSLSKLQKLVLIFTVLLFHYFQTLIV